MAHPRAVIIYSSDLNGNPIAHSEFSAERLGLLERALRLQPYFECGVKAISDKEFLEGKLGDTWKRSQIYLVCEKDPSKGKKVISKISLSGIGSRVFFPSFYSHNENWKNNAISHGLAECSVSLHGNDPVRELHEVIDIRRGRKDFMQPLRIAIAGMGRIGVALADHFKRQLWVENVICYSSSYDQRRRDAAGVNRESGEAEQEDPLVKLLGEDNGKKLFFAREPDELFMDLPDMLIVATGKHLTKEYYKTFKGKDRDVLYADAARESVLKAAPILRAKNEADGGRNIFTWFVTNPIETLMYLDHMIYGTPSNKLSGIGNDGPRLSQGLDNFIWAGDNLKIADKYLQTRRLKFIRPYTDFLGIHGGIIPLWDRCGIIVTEKWGGNEMFIPVSEVLPNMSAQDRRELTEKVNLEGLQLAYSESQLGIEAFFGVKNATREVVESAAFFGTDLPIQAYTLYPRLVHDAGVTMGQLVFDPCRMRIASAKTIERIYSGEVATISEQQQRANKDRVYKYLKDKEIADAFGPRS